MQVVTSKSFGLLIAYVIPGFVLLWGIEPYFTSVQTWLGQPSQQSPTVGGFLYVTIASVGLGQLLSTARWMLIDTLHHHTGIPKPDWSFRRLEDNVAAFDRLIEDHYRYYQFAANGIVAVTLAAVLRWIAIDFSCRQFLLLLLIDVLLFISSRDTLRKYYRRVEEFLPGDGR